MTPKLLTLTLVFVAAGLFVTFTTDVPRTPVLATYAALIGAAIHYRRIDAREDREAR